MAKKQVDQELCRRFTEARAFYAPSKAKFAKEFGINSPSLLSDIERGAREPSQSLLNEIIARGDISPKWLLKGEGAKLISAQPGPVETGPKPVDVAVWRKAVEDLTGALKARGLSKGATDDQKDLMVKLLVQGQLAGTPAEELHRQLGQLVDLLESSIRKHKGG